MKNRFIKFILIGLLFASVGEFATSYFAKQDVLAYFLASFMYGVILVFAYFGDKFIDKVIKKKAVADIVYFLIFGFIGLMTEWAIGNTPWGNPQASQFSMFMFHVTTYFAPRFFLDKREWVGKIQRAFLKYFIPYFVVSYIVFFLLPQAYLLFWVVVLCFLIGYNVLIVFYLWYFIKNFRRGS